MLNELRCFKVICVDNEMNTYDVGVMTTDEFAAMRGAEQSLFEGRHITAKAVEVTKTDAI